MQATTGNLLDSVISKVFDLARYISIGFLIQASLALRAPTKKLLVFIDGHRMLISSRDLYNIAESSNELGLSNVFGSLWS